MHNKYKNKKIAILGFGIEGKDALKFFIEKEAIVTIFDRNEDLNPSGGESVPPERWKIGKDYLKEGLKGFDYIVRSPGVYPYIPEIVDAEKNGTIVTSAVKIFFDECPGRIIGVTGTKGKGTTSTLIYEILKKGGCDVYLAGNIGKPMLELLPSLTDKSYVILEMSSFQLIDMNKSPHIAVVLNITEDHMDWHKNREEYIDAKKNIVKFQNEDDYAVLNDEYPDPLSFAKYTSAHKKYFSKYNLGFLNGEKFKLRGEHNLENICASLHVAEIVGISKDIIKETIINFKGLEHRLELVDTINGVSYYNDSFATGPQPTIAAINSFTEPETLILGGSDKGLNYKELGKVISEKQNIENVILIGDTGTKIGEEIKGKNIVNLGKTSMYRYIEVAKKLTPKGGVVILSPASASFDMFKNYKDRGNQFRKAVLSLKG